MYLLASFYIKRSHFAATFIIKTLSKLGSLNFHAILKRVILMIAFLGFQAVLIGFSSSKAFAAFPGYCSFMLA